MRPAGFVSAVCCPAPPASARGFEVWDVPSRVHRPLGLLAGAASRRRDRATRAGLARQPAADGPFSSSSNLYEPHAPYTPRSPFPRARLPPTTARSPPPTRRGPALDGCGARLFDSSEILLLSDHGEGLNDHGEEEHGILLYREALHVPLLEARDRAGAGSTVSAPSRWRTCFRRCSRPRPRAAAGPRRRRSSFAGAPPFTRRLYAETLYPRVHLGCSEPRLCWDCRWHYIDGPRPELYDVSRDPGQRRDLFAAHRDRAADARRFLDGVRTPFAPPEVSDPEELARLASLGYLTGIAPVRTGPLPNPRDALPELARMRAAFRLDADGRRAESAAALAEILSRNPDFFDARWKLANILAALHRDREAEEQIRRAIAQAPSRRRDGGPVGQRARPPGEAGRGRGRRALGPNLGGPARARIDRSRRRRLAPRDARRRARGPRLLAGRETGAARLAPLARRGARATRTPRRGGKEFGARSPSARLVRTWSGWRFCASRGRVAAGAPARSHVRGQPGASRPLAQRTLARLGDRRAPELGGKAR